jgi:hypothetical protein
VVLLMAAVAVVAVKVAWMADITKKDPVMILLDGKIGVFISSLLCKFRAEISSAPRMYLKQYRLNFFE